MNEHLSLSVEGERLIKAFESCMKRVGEARYQAYYCPARVLTIGWGHTNHHGRKFGPTTVWTQQECDDAFREDMVGFERAVKRLVEVELDQYQYDALVSFAYNCGEGNLQKSTLLKKVNRGDFDGAAREFAKWNKGGGKVLPGLVRRRASEALLFQGIADRNYDGRGEGRLKRPEPPPVIEDAMPQGVDAPDEAEEQPKSTWTSKIGLAAKGLGAGAAAETVNQVQEAAEQAKQLKGTAEDLGILDVVMRAAQTPRFWIYLAAFAVAAAVVYWRWRDHGKGRAEA